MNRRVKLIIGLGAIAAVGGVVLFFSLQQHALQQSDIRGQTTVLPRGDEDFSQLASTLAERLNEISPTPPTGNTGWIAHDIFFVRGTSLAYIDYTDTHIALRLLLEYYYQANGNLGTRVLATFIPTESDTWDLQYGVDRSFGEPVEQYIRDPALQGWKPLS